MNEKNGTEDACMRYAGVDIGGTSIKIGLVDSEKGLLDTTSFPSFPGDAEKLAEEIALRVREMDVCAIGVGTAGSVHLDTELVYASNLKWWGVPFRKHLEEKSKLPVWVDNDAQSAMMAEVFDGALQGVKNGIYLTIGTGIGGAILINGKPWRSSNNVGAEFGHMITHGDGEPCPCKRRGCFERYASANALSRMAGGLSARDVFDGAQNGNVRLQGILENYYRELAIGMVSIVSIFNPDVIAIGGGISAAGEVLLRGIEKAFDEQMSGRKDFFKGQFRLARHRNSAGVLGAAMLAKYHFSEE